MLSALSAIQRVWNTTCPIHRLPTEVLVHIFSLVPGRCPVSRDLPERNYWPFTLPAVDIHIQLAKVCKHWRNLILDAPALWSAVSESKVINSLIPNMWHLARCPRGPLSVHFVREVSPRMWSLLEGEGHRIQQLHMSYVTVDHGEAMLALLQTFPANQLEHCKIDISLPEDNRDRLLSLFSGGGKSLRSLYLCRVRFLPSNVFPRLSCLILDLAYYHENPHWDLGDLANFLAGSPGLEHLHLSRVWSRGGPHPSNGSSNRAQVVLAHLRTFTLNLPSSFIATAVPMILSIIELPRACQIQLKVIPLNELQAISPSLLSLGRPFTRMRLAIGAPFHEHTGSPRWEWSLVLASHEPDCAAIRLGLEPAHPPVVPGLLGANFSKLPLFAGVDELWYNSCQFSEGALRQILLPPKVRGLALSISGWLPGLAAGYLAQVVRAAAQLDTLCICVPNAEHLRGVREALTSLGSDRKRRPRVTIRRAAVGYDRASSRLSRGAISLRDFGVGTEVSWTGQIAKRSGEEMDWEMERLLSVVPEVLEEPASIRAAWPVWPEFLRD